MCIKPITLRNKSSPYKSVHSIQVPCGDCPECLLKYQNSWFVRFYYEAKEHSFNVFFTLTYAPHSVPTLVDDNGEVFLSVYKSHIQKWLKRIRHTISKPFKYFITSEYGPSTNRPHYHGVFFGLNADDIKFAMIDWQKRFGFTSHRNINCLDSKDISSSLRYVAKYCNKGDMESFNVVSNKVYPTFHVVSKGLGESYVIKNKEFHLRGLKKYFNGLYYDFTDASLELITNKLRVTIDGFDYQMPRYYISKIYGEKTLLSAKISDFLLRRNDALFDSQLRKLQAENPNDSAYRLMDLHRLREISRSVEKINKANATFYNNSKI